MQSPRHANFQVDPRLATLLGESYRSTEQALKELVDNAWDADAANVWITLPGAMTLDPIIVRDDGTGMTEREVRQEYLKVARDRRANKGERTPGKRRLVKGRKGIGKFAGLILAEVMTVETSARPRALRSLNRTSSRVPLTLKSSLSRSALGRATQTPTVHR
jgi:HSP90 family molecular chaperone